MIHIVASMCFIVFSLIVPPQGGQILPSGTDQRPWSWEQLRGYKPERVAA